MYVHCPEVFSYHRNKKSTHDPRRSTPMIIRIRYDTVVCSKKLTGSQLSLPHGINKKIQCETKNLKKI